MATFLQKLLQKIFPAKKQGKALQQNGATGESPSYSNEPFVYCLVGNIIEERVNQQQETIKGTKHFSPGTKVYCYPPQWGDGYENIKVIGKHRKSFKMVTMIIPSKFVTNWRLKSVYDPFIVKEMNKNDGWKTKEQVDEMLGSLRRR